LEVVLPFDLDDAEDAIRQLGYRCDALEADLKKVLHRVRELEISKMFANAHKHAADD
jgi:hypothetical protein